VEKYIVKDSSTKGIPPATSGEPERSRLEISRGAIAGTAVTK